MFKKKGKNKSINLPQSKFPLFRAFFSEISLKIVKISKKNAEEFLCFQLLSYFDCTWLEFHFYPHYIHPAQTFLKTQVFLSFLKFLQLASLSICAQRNSNQEKVKKKKKEKEKMKRGTRLKRTQCRIFHITFFTRGRKTAGKK